MAVALMVIEVFIAVIGMPSNRARRSPRWLTGTPTLPTSPRVLRILRATRLHRVLTLESAAALV